MKPVDLHNYILREATERGAPTDLVRAVWEAETGDGSEQVLGDWLQGDGWEPLTSLERNVYIAIHSHYNGRASVFGLSKLIPQTNIGFGGLWIANALHSLRDRGLLYQHCGFWYPRRWRPILKDSPWSLRFYIEFDDLDLPEAQQAIREMVGFNSRSDDHVDAFRYALEPACEPKPETKPETK